VIMGQVHQSQDSIRFRRVIAVGVVALVVFAFGSWWAWAILRHGSPRIRGPGWLTGREELGRAEIGIVDQPLFETDHRSEEWLAAKRAWLTSFGWADRRQGVVHIPIDLAITRLLARPPR